MAVLQFDRDDLVRCMGATKPALMKPGSVLGNFLVTEHGVRAINNDFEITAAFRKPPAEPCRFLVPPNIFSLLASLDVPEVSLEIGPDEIDIIAGSSNFPFPVQDSLKFPSFELKDAEWRFQCSASRFRSAIVRPSTIAGDDSRLALSNVRLIPETDHLGVIASDGKASFVSAILGCDFATVPQSNILVPTGPIEVFSRLAADADIDVEFNRNMLGMSCQHGRLYTRLSEGKIPDFRKQFAIPETPEGATFEVAGLIAKVKQALLMFPSRDDNQRVFIEMADDKLILSWNKLRIPYPLKHCNGSIKTMVSAPLLYRALRLMDAEVPATLKWCPRPPDWIRFCLFQDDASVTFINMKEVECETKSEQPAA